MLNSIFLCHMSHSVLNLLRIGLSGFTEGHKANILNIPKHQAKICAYNVLATFFVILFFWEVHQMMD